MADEEDITTPEPENNQTEKTEPVVANVLDLAVAAVIVKTAVELKEQHGDKFDDAGYRTAADAYAKEHGNIDGFDSSAFIKKLDDEEEKDKDDDKGKEKDKDNIEGGKGSSYSLGQAEDGTFVAMGSNGEKLQASSYEELSDLVMKDIKAQCIADGIEPGASFRPGTNTKDAKELEEKRQVFTKSALNNGVIIGTGGAEDPKFWEQMKEEYLKNPEHDEAQWEKLTKNIPDETLGREKKDPAKETSNTKLEITQDDNSEVKNNEKVDNRADEEKNLDEMIKSGKYTEEELNKALEKAIGTEKNRLDIEKKKPNEEKALDDMIKSGKFNEEELNMALDIAIGDEKNRLNPDKTKDTIDPNKEPDKLDDRTLINDYLRKGMNPNVPETMPQQRTERPRNQERQNINIPKTKEHTH